MVNSYYKSWFVRSANVVLVLLGALVFVLAVVGFVIGGYWI
jgi:hypothetical protein